MAPLTDEVPPDAVPPDPAVAGGLALGAVGPRVARRPMAVAAAVPRRPDSPPPVDPPPLDPDAPIPDDPGPLLPDSPDLPPAPHEPSPYTPPVPERPEPEPEPV
ncbi:hypothetical protein [Parafrankia sp. EUN1f]|uniref:hypothetical protein n=1 Tax=Parafrankia sp. EUN1f TaxID=102897 RepID=UPI0001C46CC7|nr:hypothetical protein [Parafrankia sp. EUN1f]EFC80342.1 conserved hypothetical protein [Parafrankia sp. EUN1f]